MMKKALYWGIIPCQFNPETSEIVTTTWLYGKLVDLLIWVDVHFNGDFMVVVKEDE